MYQCKTLAEIQSRDKETTSTELTDIFLHYTSTNLKANSANNCQICTCQKKCKVVCSCSCTCHTIYLIKITPIPMLQQTETISTYPCSPFRSIFQGTGQVFSLHLTSEYKSSPRQRNKIGSNRAYNCTRF